MNIPLKIPEDTPKREGCEHSIKKRAATGTNMPNARLMVFSMQTPTQLAQAKIPTQANKKQDPRRQCGIFNTRFEQSFQTPFMRCPPTNKNRLARSSQIRHGSLQVAQLAGSKANRLARHPQPRLHLLTRFRSHVAEYTFRLRWTLATRRRYYRYRQTTEP